MTEAEQKKVLDFLSRIRKSRFQDCMMDTIIEASALLSEIDPGVKLSETEIKNIEYHNKIHSEKLTYKEN